MREVLRLCMRSDSKASEISGRRREEEVFFIIWSRDGWVGGRDGWVGGRVVGGGDSFGCIIRSQSAATLTWSEHLKLPILFTMEVATRAYVVTNILKTLFFEVVPTQAFFIKSLGLDKRSLTFLRPP